MGKIFVVLILTVFGIGCTSPKAKPGSISPDDYLQVKEYLEKTIQDIAGKNRVKGLAIALVDGDNVVWVKGFGYADEAKKVSVTADTLFKIGSISKIFTATGIMRLVQEGKIKLDGKITDYIPGFLIRSRFAGAKPITVRSMLAHHSGLPADILNNMWVDSPMDLKTYAASLKGQYLVAPPQTMYRYSNIDYSMLGRIIELKTGRSFSGAMKSELLDKLGMGSSSFEITPEILKNMAKGYHGGNEMPAIGLRDGPAGNMVSSAADMAKFMRFLFCGGKAGSRQVLKADVLESMFKNQYDGLPMDFGHKVGISWMLSGIDIPGAESVAYHFGGYPQYFCSMIVLNKQKLGMVVLTNSDESKGLLDKIMVIALELMLEEKYGIKNSIDKYGKYDTPAKVGMLDEKLESYAGTYSVFGVKSRIVKNNDGLSISMYNNNIDLVPVSGNSFVPKVNILFFFPYYMSGMRVEMAEAAGNTAAVLKGLPAPFVFKKLEPGPIPEAWKKAEGAYKCGNASPDMSFNKFVLTEEDGFLIIDENISNRVFGAENMDARIVVKPLSDTDAVTDGLGYGDGVTIHMETEGNEIKLYYSGYIFSKTGWK